MAPALDPDAAGPAAGKLPPVIASSLDETRTADPATFTPPTLTAPEGSVPSGASLLEVLASYVLPGSGAPPASSIVFLILLGTLLLAAYAPRPQLSERLYLLGLMGPRSGHAMAVRRPG
jgi:hypothetical protein